MNMNWTNSLDVKFVQIKQEGTAYILNHLTHINYWEYVSAVQPCAATVRWGLRSKNMPVCETHTCLCVWWLATLLCSSHTLSVFQGCHLWFTFYRQQVKCPWCSLMCERELGRKSKAALVTCVQNGNTRIFNKGIPLHSFILFSILGFTRSVVRWQTLNGCFIQGLL